MQHQSFATKQWSCESSSNLEEFPGSDVSSNQSIRFVGSPRLGQFSEAHVSPRAAVHASLWIVSFDRAQLRVRTRLRLTATDILVESPPLREKGEFCLYRLFDEMGGSFEPETAWTPCFSINRLFERS